MAALEPVVVAGEAVVGVPVGVGAVDNDVVVVSGVAVSVLPPVVQRISSAGRSAMNGLQGAVSRPRPAPVIPQGPQPQPVCGSCDGKKTEDGFLQCFCTHYSDTTNTAVHAHRLHCKDCCGSDDDKDPFIYWFMTGCLISMFAVPTMLFCCGFGEAVPCSQVKCEVCRQSITPGRPPDLSPPPAIGPVHTFVLKGCVR